MLVGLWIGTVRVGLDLHVEDLVFGFGDFSVIVPVDEHKQVLIVGAVLDPRLL